MTERRPKILIIDDDALVRETVRLTLQHAGFDVATVESAAVALSVVRQSRPDAILLDLYMPDQNGLDLLRALKGDESTARVPVIIFTGSTEIIDIMSGVHSGAFDYITKPIDNRRLIEKIRQSLQKPAERGHA